MDQRQHLAAGPGVGGAKVLPSLKSSPMEQAAETQRLKDENKMLRERCAVMQQQYTAWMKGTAQQRSAVARAGGGLFAERSVDGSLGRRTLMPGCFALQS